jgi:cell filamentation protein
VTESKYVYPGTDVLINVPGIRDAEQLKRFEAIVTKERLAQLALQPVQEVFNLEHLKSIHHYIFKDVYPFAGKLREEDIAKDYFTFAPTQFIEPSANDLFRQLRTEGFLKGLDQDAFADRAAHYMAEINVLHPFREGNGRTQREFVRQVAQNAGYDLDWSRVETDRAFQASVRSKVNTGDLADVLRDASQPIGQKTDNLQLKDLLKQIDGVPSIWNKVELDSKLLNRDVISHKVQPQGNCKTLQVKLKGDPREIHIQMDPAPHLSKELKNQMIDQAAKGISGPGMNGKGLDFTK